MQNEHTFVVACHFNQLAGLGSTVRRLAEPLVGATGAADGEGSGSEGGGTQGEAAGDGSGVGGEPTASPDEPAEPPAPEDE